MDSDETTIGETLRAEAPARILTVRVLFEPEATAARPSTPIGRGLFAIGRSRGQSQLCLKDPRASRCHATLQVTHELTARINDRSRHGTFVNGRRIEGSAELSDGDIVRLGDSLLLVRAASTAPAKDADIGSLDGISDAMSALRHTVAQVAPTDAKVLIQGETGTGKELVARAIHARSGRRGRFVAVNCAAIPESLAESQLFGHSQGAFTGAAKAQPGFMRAADGGTLFLDEVGELSQMLQPKLLRALEQREVTPVGCTEPVKVDIRLVAATHRALLQDVDAGRFRGDLYARVAGYLVRTPPLRERPEDVLPLLRRALGEGAAPLCADLVEALLLHRFRFNVRELNELATQLTIDGAGASRLTLEMVAGRLEPRDRDAGTRADERADEPAKPAEKKPAPTEPELRRLVELHGGNVSRIARELGRSRRQVHRYLRKHGIQLG
ncbi:MAG TPA: FHA domain-containing protein [Polyangiaceae bacterium]|nr:FHA domain-containing protein [Polyangiaceae bacterium]